MLTINRKNDTTSQIHSLNLKPKIGILTGVRLSRSLESPTQSGFTLLESLIAMVVVSTLLVGIAPMLALTVAARAQARRVDLATKAAQTYLNGVRAGSITVPALPSGVTATTTAINLHNASVLTSAPTDSSTLVDTNGNGFSYSDPADLVIQPIRNGQAVTTTVTEADVRKRGFDILVRVYRADAFNSSGVPIEALQKNSPTSNVTASTFTGTLGSRTAPLTVATGNAIDSTTNLSDYANCNPNDADATIAANCQSRLLGQ
jgi:prepilin-type N-terminal cleavage/methylation domain-containing protein